MSSGWTKLHNFPVMIENFAGWGISFPSVMKPFVLGLEFVGGLCLLLGLLTQIFAPMLVVVMLLRLSEPSWVSSILWKRCSASRSRIAVADRLAGHRMCRTCLARSYVAVLVAR
jgi:hypothetical protein